MQKSLLTDMDDVSINNKAAEVTEAANAADGPAEAATSGRNALFTTQHHVQLNKLRYVLLCYVRVCPNSL